MTLSWMIMSANGRQVCLDGKYFFFLSLPIMAKSLASLFANNVKHKCPEFPDYDKGIDNVSIQRWQYANLFVFVSTLILTAHVDVSCVFQSACGAVLWCRCVFVQWQNSDSDHSRARGVWSPGLTLPRHAVVGYKSALVQNVHHSNKRQHLPVE